MSIFNGKQSGSIRTRIRHQGIRFYESYRKEQYNADDYLIRHAMSWDLLNKKKESNDLTNQLYTLHVSQ